MKRILLGSLSAAALTLGATSAFAQSGSGDMTSITCEEFLALPAMDQEDHATALTAANMSGDMSADSSMSMDGSGSMSSDSGSSDMATGGDDSMAAGSSDMAPGSDGSMAGGSSDTATGGDGSMAGGSSDMTTGSDGSMSSDSSGSMSSDTGSGDMALTSMQSPTVVALVTICENTQEAAGGSGGSSDSGSTAN